MGSLAILPYVTKGNIVKLKAAQIPSKIKEYNKLKLGRDIRKVYLNQDGFVDVCIPWHEADRVYYKMFKLDAVIKNKIYVSASNQEFNRSGMNDYGSVYNKPEGKYEIPSGFVVVAIGIYPEMCTIYTAKDSQKILESKIQISESQKS